MKRALAFFAVLMISSALAFAGPLLGVSFVPQATSSGALTVGWDFGPINIEASTANLTKYIAPWTFGALWTPSIGNFGYRIGSRIFVDWSTSVFKYTGFDFVLGVSNTWGPIELFGDLRLEPTNTLKVSPVIGINILFSELIPGKDVAI